MSFIKSLIQKESGTTAVEYAIMIGFIAIALVAVVTALGTATRESFEAASNSFPS